MNNVKLHNPRHKIDLVNLKFQIKNYKILSNDLKKKKSSITI